MDTVSGQMFCRTFFFDTLTQKFKKVFIHNSLAHNLLVIENRTKKYSPQGVNVKFDFFFNEKC